MRGGTPVFRCGYPAARIRELAEGKLLPGESYIGTEPDAKLVSAVPHANQGNSGGGLFRASDGKLIGVTVMSDFRIRMEASRLESIHFILKKAKIQED